MSAPRLRGLSARVSEAVYVALCAQAEALDRTLSSLVAQILGEAAGETGEPGSDGQPSQPEPDGHLEDQPEPGSDEEMIPRWRYELELWRGKTEARQSRLEEALGNLERNLAEAVDLGKAAERRVIDSLALSTDQVRKVEEGLAAAAATLNGLKNLSDPDTRDRLLKLCVVCPDLCRLLEERRAGREERKEQKPREIPLHHIGAS